MPTIISKRESRGLFFREQLLESKSMGLSIIKSKYIMTLHAVQLKVQTSITYYVLLFHNAPFLSTNTDSSVVKSLLPNWETRVQIPAESRIFFMKMEILHVHVVHVEFKYGGKDLENFQSKNA